MANLRFSIRRLLQQPTLAIVVTLMTLLACVVPARRAMRVDPVVALRAE